MRTLTGEQKGKLRKELDAPGAFDGSQPFGW